MDRFISQKMLRYKSKKQIKILVRKAFYHKLLTILEQLRNFFLVVRELVTKSVIFRRNLPHLAKPSWIPRSHVLWTLDIFKPGLETCLHHVYRHIYKMFTNMFITYSKMCEDIYLHKQLNKLEFHRLTNLQLSPV